MLISVKFPEMVGAKCVNLTEANPRYRQKWRNVTRREEEEEHPGAIQVEYKTATGSPLATSGRTRGEKQEKRASSTPRVL